MAASQTTLTPDPNYGSSAGLAAVERRFVAAVGKALWGLAAADEVEVVGQATLRLFHAVLTQALEGTTLPVGHLGQGVLVGPVQAVTGLAFSRVYLVGMNEGAFPPVPAPDPFGDPMDGANAQRAGDRHAFLTALAAGDGGRVTFSAPDAANGREAFPSRWLLEAVSARRQSGAIVASAPALPGGPPALPGGPPALPGGPPALPGGPVEDGDADGVRAMAASRSSAPFASAMGTSEFRRLTERGTDGWLRVVRSAQDGTARAESPADLEDRRLGSVSRWRLLGAPVASHPLAHRPDLPLAAGLVAAHERRAARFSAYDGNVAMLARSAQRLRRLLRAARPISATAVETWATCPFRFFLGSVLGVQPTPRPEESIGVDALERGTLIHRVLKRHYEATAPGDDIANVDLLGQTAEEVFADAVARGVTGHPLLWENARAEILSDLQAALLDDATWREREGFVPRRFEQPFGTDDPDAWPAVELEVGGARLRFRGAIDRVDFAPDESRAFVFDYKTGGASGYTGLASDPVLAGQHLQLAVYTRAVRDSTGEPVPASGGFWFVTRRGDLKLVRLTGDPEDIAARLLAVLAVVLEGLRDGAFPPVPGEPGQHGPTNCGYCPYDRVCPTGRDARYERMADTAGIQLHQRLRLA